MSVRKVVVLTLILALTGCGSATPVTEAPAAKSEAPAAKAEAIAKSLLFSGKDIDGKAFDAASLAGKPALLWFWAPWCATCAGQASSVQELQKEYGDRLGVLGIAGMGDNKEMHEFVSDLEIPDVRALDDEKGVVWRKFGITQQSTYVLLDASGKVTLNSYLDSVDLPAKVKALVG